MDRKVSIALIVLVLITGVIAFGRVARPQTVISRSDFLNFSYVDGKVHGTVRLWISLDATGAQIDLHQFLDDVHISHEDLVRYGLPEGTSLSATKNLTIQFMPYGDPWVYGAVDEHSLVYSDGHHENPQAREFKYYTVREWVGQSVPYRVKVTGDLVNVEKTFLAGPLGLDVGDSIEIGEGIKFTQVGFLGTGRPQMPTNYALIWTSPSSSKFVDANEVMNRFLRVGDKWGRGPVWLEISRADGPSMGGDRADYGYVQGVYKGNLKDDWGPKNARNSEWCWIGHDYLWIDIRSQDGEGDIKLAYKGRDDWYCGANVDMDVEFTMKNTTWFHPEVAVINSTNEYIASANNFPKTVDLSGKDSFTLDVRNVVCPGTFNSPFIQSGWIDIDLINATDTWDEFLHRTGIINLSSKTPYGYSWVTSSSDINLVPSGFRMWTSEPPDVGDFVPLSNYSPGTYVRTTQLYAVLKQDQGGLGNPTIILDIPAELFDFEVEMPNYGKPEILSVSKLTSTSGEAAELTVTVKNVGQARDAFVGEISGLPSTMSVVSSPNVFIDVGQTKELKFTIATGTTYEDDSGSGTVTIRALGSGFTDTDSFDWSIEGMPEPPQQADLVVTVLHSETKLPLEGIQVMLDSVVHETGSDGSTTFSNLVAGDTYTITVTDPETGVESTKTLTMNPGVNNTTIYLYGPELDIVTFAYAGLGILIAGGLIFALLRKSKGAGTRVMRKLR